MSKQTEKQDEPVEIAGDDEIMDTGMLYDPPAKQVKGVHRLRVVETELESEG